MTYNFHTDLATEIDAVATAFEDGRFAKYLDKNPAKIGELATDVSRILSAIDFSASLGNLDNAQGRGEGPCNLLSRLTAEGYGADEARIIPHGSSLSNIALGVAVSISSKQTPTILMDRTSHLSVTGGVALSGAKTLWIDREYDSELGVQHPVNLEDLDRTLCDHKEICTVWITMPTYTGYLIDLRKLRAICDKHGVLLLVDSAWGAFLGLVDDQSMPSSPASIADATVISLHKKGIGLSGMSAVLFNNMALLESFDMACDLGLVSTSPPYYSYPALDQSLSFWRSFEGQETGHRMVVEAKRFGAALGALPGVKWLQSNMLGPDVQSDPTHVLINTTETGLTGYQIMEELDDKYGIDAEMADFHTVLLLFGPRHIDTWPAIIEALRNVISSAAIGSHPKLPRIPLKKREVIMSAREATLAMHQYLPANEAVGHIAAQVVGAFPPGSAILAPGERIDQESIDYLAALEVAGSRLKGIAGSLSEPGIRVVRRETISPNS